MKIITKLSLLFAFVLISNFVFAQEEEVVLQAEKNATLTESNDSGEVFVTLSNPPEFIGGDEARMKYMQKTIHYPEKAKEKNMQGTVYVTFVVEKDGSISNVKILRGICESIDAEATRVVKGMPKWKPGMHHEKPARSQFNMPIRFVLMGDDPSLMTKEERKALKKKEKAAKKEAKRKSDQQIKKTDVKASPEK